MKIAEKFELDERQEHRIIAMAWEDRTPFEAIAYQFGLAEKRRDKIYTGANAPSKPEKMARQGAGLKDQIRKTKG